MTDLARSQSDQFVDLPGEFTGAERGPEPGYRRRREADWLSEFADEDNAAADELVTDPPRALPPEPERSAPRTTTGPFAALAPMVVLAAISSAIALFASIARPGDLPIVRHPALAELALPAVPPAPLLAAVPRAQETASLDPIAEGTGRSARNAVPRLQDQGLHSLPVSGSSPREVETAEVQGVLERYRAAFTTLSTAGFQDFWPGADTPELARTFDRLRSLRLDFHSCGVELSAGGRATARCTGRATFVPKVGSRSDRVELRAWSFGLSRVNDRWIIVSVESRLYPLRS